MAISLKVNRSDHTVEVHPDTPLLWVLRETLGLTGTKYGCGIGECGACTVHLDGEPVRSCSYRVSRAVGKEVTTIEGLGNGRELNLLQASFREHHALQCGFCTAGFLVTATELLRRGDPVSEIEIRDALSGNLCRCTGYETIVDAVAAVATVEGDGSR